MRKYNEREKEIIKALTNIPFNETETFSHFLQYHFFTEASDMALMIFPKLKTSVLYMRAERFRNMKRRKQSYISFLELVALIRYLEAMRYLSFFRFEDLRNAEMYLMSSIFTNPVIKNDGRLYLNETAFLQQPDLSKIYVDNTGRPNYEGISLPSGVHEEIIQKFLGICIVSEELHEFVRNDFKSADELRYRKQQMLAWTGIGVSLLLGLLSLFLAG